MLSMAGARSSMIYVQTCPSARITGEFTPSQSTILRSESTEGAYSIGAARRHSSGLLTSTTDGKLSLDSFEDEIDSQPGPSFKIGCRRKAMGLL
mmetsp:Transcript_98652/g.235009  ORF Transcript_98652/g.235009 Transcript_98652/m.235009 type:complete len:94 (+) Transcript_98652:58-339(+)